MTIQRIPKINELWQLDTRIKGDPFPPKNISIPPVKILGVKDGWVRYEIGSIMPDNRTTIEDFTRIYYPLN